MFDRSNRFPMAGIVEQADGTAWMAFYCATMLSMALELARKSCYEDVASKFLEHFVAIADAMNTLGGTGLWDEKDGFYYDRLQSNGHMMPTRIRSMVGLIPLLAVEVLDDEVVNGCRVFTNECNGFWRTARIWLNTSLFEAKVRGPGQRLLAIPSRLRLERSCTICSTTTSFSRALRHSFAVALSQRPSVLLAALAVRSIGWPMSRAIRIQDSSAATQTGVGPSGFLSTTC